jgi:hypothetical protein
MMQRKEVGKKRDWDSAKVGKTFVSPKGREYTYKEGTKGIAVIEYLGQEIKVEIRKYKAMPIDQILKEVELEMFLDGHVPDSVIEEQIDILEDEDFNMRDSFDY